MNADDWLKIIGGIGALLTIVGGVVVQVIVALRTQAKVEQVKETVAVIEGHVNSSASRAAAEIASLRAELVAAVAQNTEAKQTAALLAQTSASLAAAHAPKPADA